MITFLSKPSESEGFEQIIDFINANPIKYALTMNPIVYTSCIEQLWTTAKAKNINGEAQIHAMVDGKKVIISEASIRRDLRFEDEGGIDCFSNEVIFEQFTLMGYEKLTQKLTFYKAFFSPQWKFLIHIILQCLSAKTTAWNEFNRTVASAIICLAANQKFNFSMYILEIHHNVYNPSSSISQVEYAPSVHQQSDFSQPDFGLIVPVFQKGDVPIDAINHMMSFLTVFVTSRYPSTNNQLRNSSNPQQQATIIMEE
nr:hypothetical protein [Tanacetum cinerariifolium]